MGSLHQDRRIRRLSCAIGVSLALAAGVALSDSPESTIASQASGVMSFPNVKVANAPSTTSQVAKPAQNQQGLRAYVDPSTGRLRPQTVEEGKQIADETKAKLSAKSVVRSRSGAKLSSESSESTEYVYGPDGSVGMLVGDEQQVYQVVQKSKDGLKSSEFMGNAAAAKAVDVKDQAEVSHDR